MCSVSAVLDYGISNPPWQYAPKPFTGIPQPSVPPMPDQEAAEAIKRFMKLVDAAKDFDVASKQPNCEDDNKARFMDEVLARLDAIEKRLQSLPPNP